MAAVQAAFLEAATDRHVLSVLFHQLHSCDKLRQSLVLLFCQVRYVDLFSLKGKSMPLPLASSKVMDDVSQMKMH